MNTDKPPTSVKVIADVLDQLIDEAQRDNHVCFAALVRAAGLDPARDFIGAHLRDLDFRGEDLRGFNFSGADLTGADFRRANLAGVQFGDAILRGAIGFPKELQWFFQCFISYSKMDRIFVEKLHTDLHNKGVSCWLGLHDVYYTGAARWHDIAEAIRSKDELHKLLIILSKSSINDHWVYEELQIAYGQERLRKEVVLFPIRIDNAVMSSAERWAVQLRDQRNIGDFQHWKNPTEYQRSLERLLRDLSRPSSPALAR